MAPCRCRLTWYKLCSPYHVLINPKPLETIPPNNRPLKPNMINQNIPNKLLHMLRFRFPRPKVTTPKLCIAINIFTLPLVSTIKHHLELCECGVASFIQ